MALSLEGKTFGSYQILEPLGRGGMSQVYRAYHPQLNRYVAIKVLRSDLIEEESFLHRFQREAQSVASLRHPHIVQVHDFNTQEGVYYMVMELLEGDTLKTRLIDYRVRQEQMPWGEMVQILLDVLDGLAYAHDEGMIHRDLKPANILLTKRGQAVLADFGIAQIVGSTRHTMSGALLGTLNYMAPEQGLEGQCDTRSDIYSIGIIFYEMLTKEPPFDADTPLAILMKHYNDPLPLPRQLAPDIPQAFEPIVLTALAKNPDDRYQSAEAMAQALRDAVKAEGMELPKRISLPMSFTTFEAPSESVAVYSGTARAGLETADFAHDATNITALKMAQPAPEIMDSQTVHPRVITDKDDMNVKVNVQMESTTDEEISTINTIGVIIGINMLFFLFFGANVGSFFAVGWVIELFMVSYFFARIMHATKTAGLFIPAGIIFGNAILMMYPALSGNWGIWANIWPLSTMLATFVIIRAINVLGNEAITHEWSVRIGERVAKASVLFSIIHFFLSLPACGCSFMG